MEKYNELLVKSSIDLTTISQRAASFQGNSSQLRKSLFPRISINEEDKLIKQLIEMGFEKSMVNRVYVFLKPKSIENAIDLMTQINGIYQHHFYQSKYSGSKCFICNQDSSFHNNSLPNVKKLSENQIKKQNNNNNDVTINIEPLIKCTICFQEISDEKSENYKLPCGHLCCYNCWYEYIKGELLKSLGTPLHCFSFKCTELLSEDFILSFIDGETELIDKYEQLKIRIAIYESNDKKFCPHPNCSSYLEKKEGEDKYVKCMNGHEYCYVCLKPWHGINDCDEEVDKDFQLWKEGKIIKQCPKCKFWTEKNEGCNHMTCAECKYQWCWLCEERYIEGHYRKGMCKGLQFSKINYVPENRRPENQGCCRRCCSNCCDCCDCRGDFHDWCEDNFEDCCEEDCFECENYPCLRLLLIPLFYFAGIPLLVFIIYDELGSNTLSICKIILFLFSLCNFVYFQIIGTLFTLFLTVITIFYPPFNPIVLLCSYMTSMADD